MAIYKRYFIFSQQFLPVYMHIRVLVAAYLFQTGYGHFSYFWIKGDFGVYRVCQVKIPAYCFYKEMCSDNKILIIYPYSLNNVIPSYLTKVCTLTMSIASMNSDLLHWFHVSNTTYSISVIQQCKKIKYVGFKIPRQIFSNIYSNGVFIAIGIFSVIQAGFQRQCIGAYVC